MVHYFPERELSPKARDLVEFDAASLRQIVASHHAEQPSTWLASTDHYERNGRLLRDSSSPRLIAYSPESHAIYATDGCNSCSHQPAKPLRDMTASELEQFALESKIEVALLGRLVELVDQ